MTEEYYESAGGFAPTGTEKKNVHTFLNDVAIAKDTTKTGNLEKEELGTPKLPLRTYKELELFCREVMLQEDFANYFKKKGEILTASSLSKDALLVKLAVTTKKEESLDIPQPRKENKGWFKKKDKGFPPSGYSGVS